MSLTRTTVYVDSDDLAIIKTSAKLRGIAEAEIIREGVHLAAMASRSWDEPFFDQPLDLGGPVTRAEIKAVVAAGTTSQPPESPDLPGQQAA